MDTNIGVGLIVGLLIATTLYVYNTDKFNSIQKVVLYICVIFPPAQWLLILIFLTLDYTIDDNSKETKERRKILKQNSNYESKLDYLKDLKDKELLTEEEYSQKTEKINSEKRITEIQQTEEYIKLKSLYDDGILTKEELEDKIEILKKLSKEDKNNTNEEEKDLGFNIVEEVSEGYFVIVDENFNYGFANENLKVVINIIYEYAESFKEGLAAVRKNGKFGFINKRNEVIIPFKYDNAYSFSSGEAKVLLETESFYIDKKGNRL